MPSTCKRLVVDLAIAFLALMGVAGLVGEGYVGEGRSIDRLCAVRYAREAAPVWHDVLGLLYGRLPLTFPPGDAAGSPLAAWTFHEEGPGKRTYSQQPTPEMEARVREARELVRGRETTWRGRWFVPGDPPLIVTSDSELNLDGLALSAGTDMQQRLADHKLPEGPRLAEWVWEPAGRDPQAIDVPPPIVLPEIFASLRLRLSPAAIASAMPAWSAPLRLQFGALAALLALVAAMALAHAAWLAGVGGRRIELEDLDEQALACTWRTPRARRMAAGVTALAATTALAAGVGLGFLAASTASGEAVRRAAIAAYAPEEMAGWREKVQRLFEDLPRDDTPVPKGDLARALLDLQGDFAPRGLVRDAFFLAPDGSLTSGVTTDDGGVTVTASTDPASVWVPQPAWDEYCARLMKPLQELRPVIQALSSPDAFTRLEARDGRVLYVKGTPATGHLGFRADDETIGVEQGWTILPDAWRDPDRHWYEFPPPLPLPAKARGLRHSIDLDELARARPYLFAAARARVLGQAIAGEALALVAAMAALWVGGRLWADRRRDMVARLLACVPLDDRAQREAVGALAAGARPSSVPVAVDVPELLAKTANRFAGPVGTELQVDCPPIAPLCLGSGVVQAALGAVLPAVMATMPPGGVVRLTAVARRRQLQLETWIFGSPALDRADFVAARALVRVHGGRLTQGKTGIRIVLPVLDE